MRETSGPLCAGIVALTLLTATTPSLAQDAYGFDIPAQSLASALRAVAQRTSTSILFEPLAVRGIKAPALRAELTADEAVRALLDGTQLQAERTSSQTIIVRSVGKRSRAETAKEGAGREISWTQTNSPAGGSPTNDSAGARHDGEAAGSTKTTLEEIIVTANKREESLQQVALSIRALTGEALEKLGADQFSEYYRMVPSLNFQERGPGFNRVTIRGVSSLSGAGTVGIYYDDMPVTYDLFQSDIKLVDIERVEILRGPQGTLYGEGSMGGTVKVITRKPDLTRFGGQGSAGISTTEHGGMNHAVDGVINLPLIEDRFAIRALGYSRENSGWLTNLARDDKHANDERTHGGRISAKAQVTDAFSITAVALVQDQEVAGSTNSDSSYGRRQQFRPVHEPSDDDFKQYNVTLAYAAPFADIIASSSWFDRTFDFTRDLSVLAGAFGADTVHVGNALTSDTFTEEVRLSSRDEGFFSYTLGGFYKRDKASSGDRLTVTVEGEPIELFSSNTRTKVEQKALFGELKLRLTSRTSVTGGLRAFEERIMDIGPALAQPDELSDASVVTPKIVVDHQLNEELMIYALASKGFRSGGANAAAVGVPEEYRSDELWNYEIGFKSYLFDRSATLNATAFYIDWSDIQINLPRPDFPGLTYTDNAGKATSMGIEAELTARPLAGLDLSANVGYTKSMLDQLLAADGTELYPKVDLPNVPRFKVGASADYSWPITNGIDAFARVDYSYTDSSWNGVINTFGTSERREQDAYHLVGLRGGLRAGAWDVELYCQNLLDVQAQLYIDQGLSSAANQVIVRNRPRTIGVLARIRF